MSDGIRTTVVTAGDAAFAWGTLLLVASMRRNGMAHPVVAGAVDWPDIMKRRVLSLGNVRIKDLPRSRQCVACQKPVMMACPEVETEWVCWADSDAVFVGDCSEWIAGGDEEEITVRRSYPVPADFTPENLEVWRRDVERTFGRALERSRYPTRVTDPFILVHRKWVPFLQRWQRQMETVLPADVGIVMKRGTPYFQTDESVLGSLLCFDPDAPRLAEHCRANDGTDPRRHYAHFAYNPKPWKMWNPYSIRWREEMWAVADWLVEQGIVRAGDVPKSLRRGWWPLYRAMAPFAPLAWRATKLRRRLFG